MKTINERQNPHARSTSVARIQEKIDDLVIDVRTVGFDARLDELELEVETIRGAMNDALVFLAQANESVGLTTRYLRELRKERNRT